MDPHDVDFKKLEHNLCFPTLLTDWKNSKKHRHPQSHTWVDVSDPWSRDSEILLSPLLLLDLAFHLVLFPVRLWADFATVQGVAARLIVFQSVETYISLMGLSLIRMVRSVGKQNVWEGRTYPWWVYHSFGWLDQSQNKTDEGQKKNWGQMKDFLLFVSSLTLTPSLIKYHGVIHFGRSIVSM